MSSPDRWQAGVPRRCAGAAIVLGIVLGFMGAPAFPPVAAIAASSSDIPGIPLSPGVVVGQLGGSIYDAVYALDVAPGTVILASLTGSSGTDFDLYLFDDSATSVVTNQGVVARSTGSTSTESLSYATPVGGRFYIDLNSATPAFGTYTLVVQVVTDRPAVAHLVLAGGKSRTDSTTVNVSLSVSGSLSDAALMAFSADGISWQPWIPFRPATTWTFADGDGTKTLWARVQNGAGVASGPVSASVVLDTDRPSVVSIDPAVNGDLVGPRPRITVTFSEPIDAASWTQLGLVVQTPAGVLVPGDFATLSPTVGTFQPSADLVAGGVYVLTVGAVRDVAGNLVAPIGSWAATDLPAPELKVSASPRIINRGGTAQLSGTLTAPTGVSSLTLESRAVGAAQTLAVVTVPIDADGRFSHLVAPTATTEYRLRVSAAGGFGAGSASATVYVRRTVRLNWTSSVAHTGRVGSRVSIVASVDAVAPGLGMAFRLERWSPVSLSWLLVGTLSRRTDVAGRATITWLPPGAALYRWRATVASTADYSTGASPWVRWSIAR